MDPNNLINSLMILVANNDLGLRNESYRGLE